MKNATEYLSWVKALIVVHPHVLRWKTVREEAQGNAGLFRYRLQLHNGDLLEIFQLFQVVDENIDVTKYSFHWQDAKGNLKKRWDNAAHHPELKTQPHHVHEGADQVSPHEPISLKELLSLLTRLENEFSP